MNNGEVKVTYSYNSSTLIVEGSEQFAQKQIDSFHENLLKIGDISQKTQLSDEVIPDSMRTTEKYSNIISTDGGVVTFTDEVGKSKREQIINATYMYLWAKSSMGVESVSIDEIRQICIKGGFYDSKNFARYIKSLKDLVQEGNNLKLTVKSKKKAEGILEHYNNA